MRFKHLSLVGLLAGGLVAFGLTAAADEKTERGDKHDKHAKFCEMCKESAKGFGECALACDMCSAHCAR